MTNETLYINNLNERIPQQILIKTLETLFSPFGNVIEIRASKSLKARGQAFIIYQTSESASKAKESLAQTLLFSKPMQIEYAKQRSHYHTSNDPAQTQEQEQAPAQTKPDLGVPNKTLLIQDLKSETTEDYLNSIFEDLDGFVETRVFKAKNVAFIEFENIEDAQSNIEFIKSKSIGLLSYAK